ncbi:hypothetical protein BDN70DRAFT_550722 [Pholiota conissans]|uniref:Uncharacterized protein n=1 Tax=Pholiota conissans TaxID=109636 RepID=A0A9P5YM35_9AGAR|nr:hypothetical protein BDN70DRAFT_550722 [Pholiota conissans]
MISSFRSDRTTYAYLRPHLQVSELRFYLFSSPSAFRHMSMEFQHGLANYRWNRISGCTSFLSLRCPFYSFLAHCPQLVLHYIALCTNVNVVLSIRAHLTLQELLKLRSSPGRQKREMQVWQRVIFWNDSRALYGAILHMVHLCMVTPSSHRRFLPQHPPGSSSRFR